MYWDLLFLINLTVNYFILFITARLFRKQPGIPRLLFGAALGALTVLLLKLPLFPALILTMTAATPLIMIILTFWPLRRLELFILWCAVFLVSFLTGGAVLALSQVHSPGSSIAPPQGVVSLVLVCLLIYIALSLLKPYLEERKWQRLWQLSLLVSWQGKEKQVSAFLDTGNRLREPFSQRLVIIVHYRSLEGLLPPEVYRCLSNPEVEPWDILPNLAETAQARCFTLIPFSGLGARTGMLLGFKPDLVTVSRGERSWCFESSVVLGLTRRSFGPVAEYEALLPPELLQAG
jgi:stage II sporulation protein GA (sporulation sigma-E factor processing peptidase)